MYLNAITMIKKLQDQISLLLLKLREKAHSNDRSKSQTDQRLEQTRIVKQL